MTITDSQTCFEARNEARRDPTSTAFVAFELLGVKTSSKPLKPKLWECHAYLMKAGTDEVGQRYGVPERWSRSQGMIEGARIRIAHSIGPTARNVSESAAEGGSYVSAVT